MEAKRSATELIKMRRSIRSYANEVLTHKDKKGILDVIKKPYQNIFSSALRFEFIDASDMNPEEIKKLGTYGMITGAKYFIAGINKKEDGKFGLIDFGFVFEKIILKLTGMELGTCWLGGTFNKKGFSEKITLEKDEILPGVSPVGNASNKRSVKDSTIRTFIRADRRKPWNKIFFKGGFQTPIEQSDVEAYRVPLDMVRLGPSASNLQPWRVIKDNGNTFHFFLNKSRSYKKRPDHLNLQYIDMGICLCHFSLTCSELGLKGRLEVKNRIIEDQKYEVPDNTEYIISWIG